MLSYASQTENQIAVRVENGRPVQFVWRRRLWHVLKVQHCWVEPNQWWLPGDLAENEKRFWRVEAANSAESSTAIYDLVNRDQAWWLQACWD